MKKIGPCKHLKFSSHAVQSMFERNISSSAMRGVIDSGEAIADYPDDTPYPSQLLLGFEGHRPLHVVYAFHEDKKTCYIVTVYEPDPAIWTDGFRQRRS